MSCGELLLEAAGKLFLASASWRLYPTIQFTSSTANNVAVFVLALAIFAVMVWATRVLLARCQTFWMRAIGISAVPLLTLFIFGILFASTLALVSGDWKRDTDEQVMRVPAGSSTIVAYRTNGGATTDYGIVVRRERVVYPGVLYVHPLLSAYPAHDATFRRSGDRQVEIVIPAYHEGAGRRIRIPL